MSHKSQRRRERRGQTAVEVAIVLPIFFVFLFGMFEIGRVFWISHMLHNATTMAARFGAIDGVSNDQILDKVRQGLASSLDVDQVVVTVKNASNLETSGSLGATSEQLDALPNIELANAQSRQLFLVRATVDYRQIEFIRLPFTDQLVLAANVLKRHE